MRRKRRSEKGGCSNRVSVLRAPHRPPLPNKTLFTQREGSQVRRCKGGRGGRERLRKGRREGGRLEEWRERGSSSQDGEPTSADENKRGSWPPSLCVEGDERTGGFVVMSTHHIPEPSGLRDSRRCVLETSRKQIAAQCPITCRVSSWRSTETGPLEVVRHIAPRCSSTCPGGALTRQDLDGRWRHIGVLVRGSNQLRTGQILQFHRISTHRSALDSMFVATSHCWNIGKASRFRFRGRSVLLFFSQLELELVASDTFFELPQMPAWTGRVTSF